MPKYDWMGRPIRTGGKAYSSSSGKHQKTQKTTTKSHSPKKSTKK